MEICVHVGAHRTGTTGFQMLLEHNRANLQRARVAFWGPNRTRSGLVAGLIKNPDFILKQDDTLARRSRGRIQMEIDRLRQAGRDALILSEENLIGTMTENLASGCLYGQAQRRFARIAPAFETCRTQIWLSWRSYDLHWASQIAFRIKVGALAPDQYQTDALAAQWRRWSDLVVCLKQAMPDAQIKVWRFEDWVGRPSALLDALLHADLALHEPSTRPSNASAGAHALSALVAGRGDVTGAAHLARHNHLGRYMPFSAAQRAEMQQHYRDDLTWLKAGAEGCATYLDPTEGTFGGHEMTEGSPDDRQDASVASPR